MKDDVLSVIKSRGYWRINFQPLAATQKLSSLGLCKDVVEKNVVELRGWDYPYFPRRHENSRGLEPTDTYYHAWIDWQAHKEYWRFYQSGQFIHYLSLREDWMKEDSWYADHKAQDPGVALSIVGTIYQLTEIHEFLSRLTRSGLYDEGVRISITLFNTNNRQLRLFDLNRVPFMETYKTGADKIIFERQYKKDQILSEPKELAFESILFFFDKFGWHAPNREMIKKDQENLLAKRI